MDVNLNLKSDLFILELPQYPNVDAFNFETMKKMLIEKLDSFNSAPFTIQRICELLADPRKQYSRIDKFMRAVEKTILVVSTQEPGRHRSESENGDSLDSALNGGDFASEVNVEIDMDSENSFSTKDFSATTTATAKNQNHEVTTTTTTTATTTATTDVTSVASPVKAPETNGSTEKPTEAVPKTDDEEVKSEPAIEVASVTSSDNPTASSSNSETEVTKDEDKSPTEEKTEKEVAVTEVRVEVAEEEEPESIEEEIPEEAEEDEDLGEIVNPVTDDVPVCDTTSKLPGDADDGLEDVYSNTKEIIVTVSDPSVIAVVLPIAALESIVKDQQESDVKSTSDKLEQFADSSARMISEDSSSGSPDESESDTKRMKYTVSPVVTQTIQENSTSSDNTASSSTTTSSSSTAESEEQQPQVGSTTTNDTNIVEEEDKEQVDKAQELISTGDATPSTTEVKEAVVVEAKPMNEEVPIECAEAVAVASSSETSVVSEMEATSSAAPVESKMSLDEDVTSEITEESVPLITINKMDTETEADAMDVDESEASSEPMDQ